MDVFQSVFSADFAKSYSSNGRVFTLKFQNAVSLYTEAVEKWIQENAYWITFQGSKSEQQRIKSRFYALAMSGKVGSKVFFDAKKSYDRQVKERGTSVQKLSVRLLAEHEKYGGDYQLVTNELAFREQELVSLVHELRHYEQQHRPSFRYVYGNPLNYMIFQKRMEVEAQIQHLFFLEETHEYVDVMQYALQAYQKKAQTKFFDTTRSYHYIVTNLERYLLDDDFQFSDDLDLTDEQKKELKNRRQDWNKQYNYQMVENFSYSKKQSKTTENEERSCINSIGYHMESDLSWEQLKEIFSRRSFYYEDEKVISQNFILNDELIQIEQTKEDGALTMYQRTVDYIMAFKHYSAEFALKLSDAIGDINRPFGGTTLLHIAVEDNVPKLVKECLKRGANVDAIDVERQNITPLHLAVDRGHYECAQLLLEHGASVHALTEKNETPLNLLYTDRCIPLKEKQKIAKILLEKGADINHPNQWGYTLIGCACIDSDIHMIRLALLNGALINTQYLNDYETPLKVAVTSNDIELVQYFVKSGFPITKKHIYEAFVNAGRENVATYLFNVNQSRPKANDMTGVAIEALIKRKYDKETQPLLEYIIQKGGNINLPSAWTGKYTLLDYARSCSCHEIAECLEKNGGMSIGKLNAVKFQIHGKIIESLKSEYYYDKWIEKCVFCRKNNLPVSETLIDFIGANPQLVKNEAGQDTQEFTNWKIQKGYDGYGWSVARSKLVACAEVAVQKHQSRQLDMSITL